MCLCTVYTESNGEKQEIMQDVARMISTDGGYRLVSLFGGEQVVSGRIRSVDFIDTHTVVIERGESS
jgi:predicted RNA-binding protein